MVHYIRFLKLPLYNQAVNLPKRALLSALITITTDLGDAFYPGELSVFIGIVNRISKIKLGLFSWKSGMRCLKIELKVPLEYLTSRARLLFTCSDTLEADPLHLGRVPNVVSAWTEEFTGPKDPLVDAVVRRFALPKGKVLEVCENNGESIARHIWDAAIALTSWLSNHKGKVQQPDEKQYTVLELGTGCGMIGLVLASMSQNQNCRLILTDLDDDSLKLAKTNAHRSREVFNSVWQCCILDWREPQKFTLDERLALIVASDCIYNSDNIPDLVNTISHLVRRSCDISKGRDSPKIIVSTKRRHPSEEMFFDLMGNAGFKQTDHDAIPMCDQYRESTGQEFEVVNIHIFEKTIEA